MQKNIPAFLDSGTPTARKLSTRNGRMRARALLCSRAHAETSPQNLRYQPPESQKPAPRARRSQASRRVRTNGVFTKGAQFLRFCHMLLLSAHVLPHFPILCYMLPHVAAFCSHLTVKVHSRELRHFCDDPFVPTPVWKPVRRKEPRCPASLLVRLACPTRLRLNCRQSSRPWPRSDPGDQCQ